MKIAIIDYGMGNLGSVARSLEICGADPLIAENPKDLRDVSGIILPGVGAFRDGMANLESQGWIEEIKTAVVEEKIPLLGICLGMQLLATKGQEGGDTLGLNLIPGEVRRMEPHDPNLRIPHVGWNEVNFVHPSPLLSNIPERTDFYFVHSYTFFPSDADHIVATTPYGGPLVSVVASGNIYGTQFHPEKSSKPGFQLLKNFLNLAVDTVS